MRLRFASKLRDQLWMNLQINIREVEKSTRFKVGGALFGELEGHVAVDARDGRAVDEDTQARLAQSFEGVAAGFTWWDGTKRSNCSPARY